MALIAGAARDLVVPDPVAVEVDYLVRTRYSAEAARAFLEELAAGTHRRHSLTSAAFARAVEIDRRYAALDLGLVDACVMAVAEAESAAILTFDFAHFRATVDEAGRPWRLVVDEDRYAAALAH